MNNNVIIGNELPEITQLKARLAAVEAELDTAEGRRITAEGYLATLMDERDALAAQNVRLREALEGAQFYAKRQLLNKRADGSHVCNSPKCFSGRCAGDTVEMVGHAPDCPLADAFATPKTAWSIGHGGQVVASLDSASAQASDAIIARIKEERRLQDRKWGGPTYDDKHSLGDWAHFIDQRTETLYRAPERKVAEQELIEVAALAIAALESLRRNREGK
jgi:hypothetical protein